MKRWKIYIQITVNLFILIIVAIISIYFIPKFIRFFMPFVIGWIIAMIANPLVKFLEKRVKLIRKHSSALIIVFVVTLIIGAFYLIGFFVVKESISLMEDIPNIYKNLEVQLDSVSERLQGIYKILPANIQNTVDKIGLELTEYGSKLMSDDKLPSIDAASEFAKNIFDVFLASIITILSAYFFIAERDNIARDISKMMPNTIIKSYRIVIDNFKTAVGGYFKAQFKIMLILILILFVGFELLKVNYSFLLAILIAFLDFLPLLGTGAVIWPWALIDFLLGNYVRAIFLVAIYLICQIVKQVLQPKMVGDSIGISPLATLLFMYIGYKFYKVLGMIIGIPIGMVLISFYRLGMFNRVIRGFKIILHDLNEFRKF